MNLPDITKFPVYIISTPRTGSTVLQAAIAEKYNLNLFCEPDESSSVYDMNDFANYARNNSDYVVKLHGHNINRYPEFIIEKIYSNDVFKISIDRIDRIGQIASNLLAQTRDIWGYTVDTVFANDEIQYSDEFIERNISYIDRCYSRKHALDIKYDYEIFYENLNGIDYTKHIKTPLPSNYEELLAAIRKIYEKY